MKDVGAEAAKRVGALVTYIYIYIYIYIYVCMGTAVAQWLRCCATNRKVAGSITAGVTGFLIDKILPIAL